MKLLFFNNKIKNYILYMLFFLIFLDLIIFLFFLLINPDYVTNSILICLFIVHSLSSTIISISLLFQEYFIFKKLIYFWLFVLPIINLLFIIIHLLDCFIKSIILLVKLIINQYKKLDNKEIENYINNIIDNNDFIIEKIKKNTIDLENKKVVDSRIIENYNKTLQFLKNR